MKFRTYLSFCILFVQQLARISHAPVCVLNDVVVYRGNYISVYVYLYCCFKLLLLIYASYFTAGGVLICVTL